MRTLRACLRLAVVFGCLCGSWAEGAEPAPTEFKSPLSAEQSLRLFQIPEDVRIEIAAAEPEVIDPVAIRFDELGQMWVVEMRDYPLGPAAGQPPLSQIRVLSDRDGDGRFETSVLFADKLLFATGLQPWRGGVFVTMSGRVAYLKDTNGDGRADVDETWYTGFAEANSQLRANHPRLALNGWVYVANGLKGGKIKNHRQPESAEVVINGMDFRFHPITGACEAVTGNGQFGLTFDDWGNRFVCSNRNPVQHVVFENEVLKRHPEVSVAAVMNDVAVAGEKSRIFPISRAWTTSNLHAGQFTAACGVTIYRGDALPPRYRGQPFVCDPTGNLVHWEIMERSGGTFASQPGLADKEFLASPDEWFRPVNLETGPDGALYVIDMYRAVIEHPEWVPAELKKRPDERWGEDRGRIYRLTAKDWKRPKLEFPVRPDKDGISKTSNGWRKDTLQRLEWEGFTPESLANLLPLQVPMPSLEDQQSEVLFQELLQELASTEEIIQAGEVHGQDLWFRVALRMAVAKEPVQPLVAWTKSTSRVPVVLITDVAATLGQHGTQEQLSKFTEQLTNDADAMLSTRTMAVMAAIIQQTEKRKWLERPKAVRSPAVAAVELNPIKLWETFATRFRTVIEQAQRTVAFLDRLAAKAKQIVTDEKSTEGDMLIAINYLPLTENGDKVLAELLAKKLSQPLQIAAITAFARVGSDNAWGELLDRVPQEGPLIRRTILDQTLSRNSRITLLFDRLAAEKIRIAELEPTLTARLLATSDPALKQRAQQLLAAAVPTDRVEALARYQPALDRKGDALAGKILFQKNCATCHKIGTEGVNVAPDISDSRTKTHAQLLTDIVQPNRAIDANYVAYNVALESGEVVTGVLSAETATSITLRQPGDKTVVIPRGEITLLKSTGVSLMPEGLERNITVEQMADLLSFIKNWRYLDGLIPFTE